MSSTTLKPRADPPAPDGTVTGLLQAWADGSPQANEELFEEIYPELRKITRQFLAREGARRPLQTTELAHETYLRLTKERNCRWHNRGHFFALFATHVRRVLVDLARRRNRLKRGGDRLEIDLEHLHIPVEPPRVEILALDEALRELARVAPSAAQIIDLRFFAGLNLDETAVALGLGRTTVKRKWRFSRAWLAQALEDGP